jgi:hypothetical protein
MLTAAHRNLFPGALPHVADWTRGRLELRSAALYSSQALCISVFGTLATASERAAIVREIISRAGIEMHLSGQAELECEVRGRHEVLNEYGGTNPTCPDVLIEAAGQIVIVESKFTEHLGVCGQTTARKVRGADGNNTQVPAACSGYYEVGSDLRTQTAEACRLTTRERRRTARRYWEVASRLFRPDVLVPPKRPCPFRGGNFQLMRSICFGAALAALHPHRPDFCFLLAYVAAAPVAVDTQHQFAEFREMLLPEVARRVGAISYEQIEEILRCHELTGLAEWLHLRLREGIATRQSTVPGAGTGTTSGE